jgi:hypothetical protein
MHQTLQAAVGLLPDDFRARNAGLWLDEHLTHIAGCLLRCVTEGVPARPAPHFTAECTPPLADAWAFFRAAVEAWARTDGEPQPEIVRAFADALLAADTGNLLLLLGQRRTPATLCDERGIPPARATLLASAETPHLPGVKLCVAARALDKHNHRSPDPFWPVVRGPEDVKNAAARRVVEAILDGATWWNVFGHYAHDAVFEARLPSGHGVRWGHDGAEFIGFLEPWSSEFPLRR